MLLFILECTDEPNLPSARHGRREAQTLATALATAIPPAARVTFLYPRPRTQISRVHGTRCRPATFSHFVRICPPKISTLRPSPQNNDAATRFSAPDPVCFHAFRTLGHALRPTLPFFTKFEGVLGTANLFPPRLRLAGPSP